MTSTAAHFFEGRVPGTGQYVFTVFPEAGIDQQLHRVPAELPRRKHQLSDDCWCIPRVQLGPQNATGATWIYDHRAEEKRHSDEEIEQLCREDAGQGGVGPGFSAPDRPAGSAAGEEDSPPQGGSDMAPGGGLT
ncbi:hypothetical protein SEA_MOLLYMUR_1 [Gordonia phage Mollymur]|uniref:Uncharacterized protein n=1 Tax=Gordonia phage Mollymur TaxID=2590895 RepID=A0A4Y6E9L5_9CAUD|nr:hypothetical protein PQB84_gp001 [Gordonia phage Mollymur]QDF15363.1 hypothetical protein SEA_MOLLYMUR_1 [Gordonia phage Mollymur]